MGEKEINGRVYSAPKLPADQGFRLLIQLSKLIAPVLPEVPHLANLADAKKVMESPEALTALKNLLMASDPDAFVTFVINCVKQCRVQEENGTFVSVAHVMSDLDIGDLIPIFLLFAGENFTSFFATMSQPGEPPPVQGKEGRRSQGKTFNA